MRRMSDDLKTAVFCGISLVAGLAAGYFLGYYKFGLLSLLNSQVEFGFSKVQSFLVNLPKDAFLPDLITLEAGLIGVAIPIALNIVTLTADRYRDPEIAQFFTNEFLYRFQYFSLLLNITVIIFLRFSGAVNILILWLLFFWFATNIITFYKFIKLVEQYAANTDKILRGKLNKYVEAILKK